MATIVLVVANAASLSNGDIVIRDQLLAAGHEIVLRNDEDAEYTGTYDGVVVADSTANATFGSKYNTVAKPGLCTESLTSGWRLGSNTSGVDGTSWVVNNVPAANGGLLGSQTIYTTTTSQQGLNPAGDHTVVATRPDGDAVYVIWESGAALSTGNAPAKRTFFRLSNSAGNQVTTELRSLLDAAIAWTFGPIGTAPTVDAGGDVPSWPVNTEFARTAVVDDGGLATTTAWTIQTGPSGQGSTISNTAELAWTPSVTGTYTLRATSTNSAGSDFDDMTIEVVAASSSLRMYMTATNLASMTLPGAAPWWDAADAIALDEVHQLSSVPEGPAEFRTATEVSATTPFDACIGRWVSGPAQASGTLLADEVQLTMARGESSTDADLVWAFAVRVITSAGALKQEMLGVFFSAEWPVIASATECVGSSATVSPGNVTAVNVAVGDRVLLEVGFRANNSVTTPQSGTIIFGGQGTPDLAPGDTGSSLERPSWIDIPVTQGLTFADDANPGGGGAPGDVFDLDSWKITLPTEDPADPGDADEVLQPELQTYSDEHFFLNASNQMVMVAPTVGETTGGSEATRCELREMVGSNEAAWSIFDTMPRHLIVSGMFDPTSITGGSNPRQEMIIGQIHGELGNPPIYLAAEYHVATPRIRIYKYNGTNTPGLANVLAGVTPTTEITYKMEYVPGADPAGGTGRLNLYFAFGGQDDLPGTPSHTFAPADFFSQTTGWYFKAGAYNKTTVASGSTGEARATITYLELNQGGVIVDPWPMMQFFFGSM